MAYNGENHLVVWCDEKYNGKALLACARVTPQAAVLDTGNYVGIPGNHYEYSPDLDYDGNRSLVVWWNHEVGDSVCGRFVNNAGLPAGPVVTIGRLYNFSLIFPAPRIAFDNTNYLVVWHDKFPARPDYDICGQFVSPAGALVGDTIVISRDTTSQVYPGVAFDGATYLVVWSEHSLIYGQRIAPDGHLIDTAFVISDTAIIPRASPAVAASSSNYLLAWPERRGNYDLYGNVNTIVGGANEYFTGHAPALRRIPTIIGGPLPRPFPAGCRIFDITGRPAAARDLKPGVYFVEVRGQLTRKIIKVR